MEKSQLDNLINFAFIFHIQCDSKWMNHDVAYFLDKWQKIIGTKSTKNVFIPECENIKNWTETWRVTDSEYNEVKQILSFIRQLNSRPINNILETDNHLPNNNWRPDDLVKLYKNNIGDPNLISKDYYGHIHESIKRAIKVYKNKYLREYNLTLLLV